MKEHDSTDRLLRRNRPALENRAAAGRCLDAETIAAWSSGALPAERRAEAEAHVADCSRCLGIVAALAQTEPVPAPRSWAGWLPLRWLVPVTAAATAVFLWVMVERPADRGVLSGPPAEQAAARLESSSPDAEPREPSAPPAGEPRAGEAAADAVAPRDMPAAAAAASEPSVPAKPFRSAPEPPLQPAETQERTQAVSKQSELAESVALAPSAPSPPATPLEAGARASRSAVRMEVPAEILSPDPTMRWRIAGTIIERSVDGGGTWHRQEPDAPAPLLAGSAPSPTVCWVAGASGTVLRSTDGDTWTRVSFPEPVDLAAITSTDAQTAVVTAADGRIFRTTDGGRTWTLQETPAAPF